MKPKCIDAVNAAARAAGRADLTPSQIRAIDERMGSVLQRLASADPQRWRSLTPEARTLEAAEQAMKDIRNEAARKVDNARRQIIKAAETQTRIDSLADLYKSGRNAALVRDMENTGHYIDGVKSEAVSGLVDLLEAGKSGQGIGLGRRALMVLFDAENPAMSRDLATEIFSNAKGGTGNSIAQKAAQAWLDTIEGMRTRFNSAGGEVRKLDYGYLPQPHDSARVLAAGRDPWATKMLPLLDRSRYINEDGTRMSDAEVTGLLQRAWETIGTDGLNKLVPGQFQGTGARANRGNDARQLHFKDADAYLEYMGEYGQGSMYDAMISHIGGISRDIGLVERYGPNPEQQMRVQLDTAKIADNGAKRVFWVPPESYWSVLTGKTAMPQSASIARVGADLRNIQTAAKLGGAVISSVTDLGTYFVTAGYNKLSYWQAISNVGKAASPETKEFLTMHGVIADSMISDMNRWAGEHISQNWSGRLANSTMKLSFMNAWTDTLRNGFQMSMMQGLAKLSRTEWAGMSEYDRVRLQRHGITEQDWGIITQAKLTEHRGMEFLTPEAIATSASAEPRRVNEVIAKVLGMVKDESEYAVINPDMTTKAIQTWGGLQSGTVSGELARSVMQFKSFPVAMLSRHWRRMMDAPQVEGAPLMGNRLAYGAGMALTLTLLGAVAFQAKQVVSGKDPVAMDSTKFWMRAGLQGGAMGILGDLFLQDPSDSPGDTVANAVKNTAGPSIGAAFELVFKIGGENVWEASKGKDTHAAAEALRFLKSNTPLINLWYTKSAIDHALLQHLQESLSPGYLARMRARAKKDWGQDYWWELGETAPDRAPDMSAIGGK